MRGDAPGGPIRWRMHLRAAPERVYDAIDSDAGRAAFWAEEAVEERGAIGFRFANGARIVAPIVARERPRRFVVDYFAGRVTIEIAGDGHGGTDLALRHDGVDEAHWNEVHAGWLNVLFPLKAYVDHGVDLRNHDAQRTWDQGYADQ